MTPDETELLAWVRGERGHLSGPMWTYSNGGTAESLLMHEALERLEAAGLVRRKIDQGREVLWEAVQPGATELPVTGEKEPTP